MFLRNCTRRLTAVSLAAVALFLLPAPAARAAELETLLAGFDEVQESIRTLSARFTETHSASP